MPICLYAQPVGLHCILHRNQRINNIKLLYDENISQEPVFRKSRKRYGKAKLENDFSWFFALSSMLIMVLLSGVWCWCCVARRHSKCSRVALRKFVFCCCCWCCVACIPCLDLADSIERVIGFSHIAYWLCWFYGDCVCQEMDVYNAGSDRYHNIRLYILKSFSGLQDIRSVSLNKTPKDIELFCNQDKKITTPITIMHCTHNSSIPLNFKQWWKTAASSPSPS